MPRPSDTSSRWSRRAATMADPGEDMPGIAPLVLRDVFPPVSTAEWEALVRATLKGDDEQRLSWRPEDGVVVKPFYRSEDLVGLDRQVDAEPGQPPFVRGDGRPCEPLTTPAWPADAIRADRLHDAGATAVQQLAFAHGGSGGPHRGGCERRHGRRRGHGTHRVRLRRRVHVLRRDRQAARRSPVVGRRAGGIRCACTGDAPARAHCPCRCERARSLDQPAARHD